jgi:hypothetical protein
MLSQGCNSGCQRIGGVAKLVAFLELRTVGGVTVSMTDTEILANEGTVAAGVVAAIDVFGSVWDEVGKVSDREDGGEEGGGVMI